jgi:hypothetical protein
MPTTPAIGVRGLTLMAADVAFLKPGQPALVGENQ